MLLSLVLFGLPAAAIDFFHVEHELCFDGSCPACQLHQASSADASALTVTVPTPTPAGTVEPESKTSHGPVLVVAAAARAPPLP